jgi:WXG100 family type VII secretion target
MTGPVQVDTGLMQTTARQSGQIGENMITHAKTLSTGIDFVMRNWTGQAGDAFRNTMGNQIPVLGQLIEKLKLVAETVNRGAQGLDSQDASGRSNLTNQGQNFLNGPLNH